jgi:hypothetical protein
MMANQVGNGTHEELLPGFDFAEAERAEAFHGHLRKCGQCHDNPFNLCQEGLNLLKSALG